MQLVNPTGRGIRNDEAGAGTFGAPRGHRTHNGTDFLCVEGQEVFSPISGVVVRESKPYASDPKWSGVLIRGKRISVKLWYLRPANDIIGSRVSAGEVVGIAQAISKKHGGLDHIHLKVEKCDPMLLMEGFSI